MLGIILTDSTTTALKMPAILDAIRRLKSDKLVIFAPLDEGAPCDAAAIRELRQLGVACFPSPRGDPRSCSRYQAGLSGPAPKSCRGPTKSNALDWLRNARYRSKELLKELGVVIPEGGLARSLDEALVIARRIGFPLALKAQAVELPHKSDVGGVVLGIASEDALTEGWVTLHRNLSNQRPGLKLDGVLVERMSQKGVELILGARNDPDWGPVLLAVEPEYHGIEEEPDHEIFPVNVDPSPVVRESGRQQIPVMGLGKLIAEKMKHAAGHVKLTRNPQVKQVVADEITHQARRSLNLGRGNQQLVIDQPVAEQLNGPPKHHLQAAPLDRMDVVGEVAALQASGNRRPENA